MGVILAAPVHQMQQYYRLGVLDNCSGKWSALYDCLTLKTKQSSEALVRLHKPIPWLIQLFFSKCKRRVISSVVLSGELFSF